MHPANYVFGTAGLFNQTGGWNTGIAFLFGVLSVQWTVCLWCNINANHLISCVADDGQKHSFAGNSTLIFVIGL